MVRVFCLIDGFNLYHFLHNCHPDFCKWCNYKVLVNHFLDADDVLEGVYYFTAYANWDRDKQSRHRIFIKALQHVGVKVVLGKFKEKYLKCRICQKSYLSHEEKESDVNLAVKMISLAYEDKFDKVLLVSGDSDFVSTIKRIKTEFPDKTVGALIPFDPRRPHIANHIRRTVHFSHNIERGHLLSSLLPKTIILQNGDMIACPSKYIKA